METATRLERAAGVTVWLLLTALAAGPAAAQERLTLKRAAPAAELVCAAGVEAPASAAAGAGAAEVERLTNAATQAMILGDLSGALEFLNRALALDPLAAEAVYLRGRILHQQNRLEEASASFCRYLALEPRGPSAGEARERLEEALEGGVGADLREAFQEGVAQYEAGRLEEAEMAFTRVLAARPAAATALFNRGLVRAVRDRPGPARDDLERYARTEPTPPDALTVRRFLLGLPGRGAAPSPATAFGFGLFPGGGQYYTGRPAFGLAVTAVAAGAVATGILYERTIIRCRDASLSECPEELIASRSLERPLLVPAVGAALGVALLAAVEAALHAGRERRERYGSPSAGGGSAASALGERLEVSGGEVRVSLIRLEI